MIGLLILYCKDIELSKKFYSDLGMTFKEERHGDGPVHYSTEINGLVLELFPTKKEITDEGIRIGLNVKINDHKSKFITDPDGRKVYLLDN